MRRILASYLQSYLQRLVSEGAESDDEEDQGGEPSEPAGNGEIELDNFVDRQRKALQEHEIASLLRNQTCAEPNDNNPAGTTTTTTSNNQKGNVFNLLNKREQYLGKKTYTKSFNAVVGQRYIPNCNRGPVAEYDHQGFCGQFSKDGTIFMSACQDQVIRLYHTEHLLNSASQPGKGRPKFAKPFKQIYARDVGWSIIDTHYSPDQRAIAYSSWSHFVYFATIYDDGLVKKHEAFDLMPEAGRFCAFSIRFSPDSNEILAGGSDYCLYMYDINAQKRTMRVKAHDDDVNSVAFADESGNILFSGSDDSFCKVWDKRTLSSQVNKPVGVLPGHIEGITSICSKGDGVYFISNGKDQCMKLWDVRKMKDYGSELPKANPSHRGWDYRFQYVPARYARSHHPHDASLMTYTGHKVLQTLIRCYFSPASTTAQRYLYSGSQDGSVYIFDLLTGEIVQKLTNHSGVVRDVSWVDSPHGPTMISTSWDCTCQLWTFQKNVQDPKASLIHENSARESTLSRLREQLLMDNDDLEIEMEEEDEDDEADEAYQQEEEEEEGMEDVEDIAFGDEEFEEDQDSSMNN